ncbi:MAG: saccharopine dehydrogenase NADP-binding domain-containing protein [Bacteroidetes bacterium]|nr:saccharopine dehydrogenase NADP-binding domain-containing protein [Bacteroidota bacterium]
MKKILLFGAGKSATVLIDYLLSIAAEEKWFITIVDADLKLAQSKIGNSGFAKAVSFDINNETERGSAVSTADIVISLLPPALHFLVAKDCLLYSKNLLTASYVDDKIKELKEEIENKQLLFLCEMGLDPGIDHMSAMRIIDDIHAKGGAVVSFKSHCGGLVAPESDDNPWHYKISWNPRNIVLAGKAGAVFKEEDKKITIAYDKIFENCPEINVEGLPVLAYYPNRDSLNYATLYGLEETSTFIRTTLRYASFCRGWDVICHLGLTDTEDDITKYETISEWFHDKLRGIELRKMDWLEYLQLYVNENYHTEITEQVDYLGLFEIVRLPNAAKCSADVLQNLLEAKLVLKPGDKDMIVMLHEIKYTKDEKIYEIRSSLVVKGENSLRTAMAKTVGLPLGIAAKLILKGKINQPGLHIPVVKEIYEPVLKELELQNIHFVEKQE